jgi:hypothetical protein
MHVYYHMHLNILLCALSYVSPRVKVHRAITRCVCGIIIMFLLFVTWLCLFPVFAPSPFLTSYVCYIHPALHLLILTVFRTCCRTSFFACWCMTHFICCITCSITWPATCFVIRSIFTWYVTCFVTRCTFKCLCVCTIHMPLHVCIAHHHIMRFIMFHGTSVTRQLSPCHRQRRFSFMLFAMSARYFMMLTFHVYSYRFLYMMSFYLYCRLCIFLYQRLASSRSSVRVLVCYTSMLRFSLWGIRS